ncbi:protein-glutamate O-methyltransferase CheR [Undibacterium sp.]|uniref:protein-glutamate O-methyltransferase CheR n=1 Tax=Undibacterium sp. TaxID=1914977 RepID=UPI002CF6F1A3|nr:protein-glutamate O-methyltransferase CheR [Undibacterium sp.]HTD02582.1 protein-glutamate O-methyltransferase CheR [Undibacterium sp.]
MTPLPTVQELSRFRGMMAQLLGLNIDELRLSWLDELLRRRAHANGNNCAGYLDELAGARIQAGELAVLAQELTVTETYFFRNPSHFSALVDIALPARLAARAGRQHLHILSAGCASGEEAYSMAIAVREHFPHAAHHITITAIDFNPAALGKAQQAQYSSWSLRDVAADTQARWFKNANNSFLLDQEVRQAVKFERRNLALDDPDFWWDSRFDIVFCRNVLMYFTLEQAQAAMRRIALSLAPDGYLFMGHAETLRGLSNDFHLCHTHETFYYQRKAPQAASESAAGHAAKPGRRWQEVSVAGDTSWIETIQAASERIHDITAAPTRRPAEQLSRPVRPVLNLDHAMEYLHKERFDRVLEQIGILPKEHANDTDVLLLKAVSLCHSGASMAAEEVCRELLGYDELNAGAHYVLALCRESAGDMQNAIDQDQMAAYLDPAFAMPRLHMGLLANRRGDKAAAMAALNQALLLLQQEDPSRILLFGGGFKREALLALCRSQLDAVEARS